MSFDVLLNYLGTIGTILVFVSLLVITSLMAYVFYLLFIYKSEKDK